MVSPPPSPVDNDWSSGDVPEAVGAGGITAVEHFLRGDIMPQRGCEILRMGNKHPHRLIAQRPKSGHARQAGEQVGQIRVALALAGAVPD